MICNVKGKKFSFEFHGKWCLGRGVGHCVQSHHKTEKACMGFGVWKKRTELVKIEMEDYR